jgi:hypothetical protein
MSSDVRHHRVSHTFRCRITWLGSQLSPAYWSNDVSRDMGLKPAHSCTLLPRPILRTQHTSGFCKNLFPSLLTAVTTHLCQNSRWNLDVFLAAWKTSILNLEEFGPSFPPGRLLPFNFEHIESGSCSSLPETPHIFLPSIFFFNPVICLSAHLQEKAFISEMPLFKLRLTKAVFRPCFSERVLVKSLNASDASCL